MTALDPDAHTVTTQGGQTIGYRKLVLATGSQPTVPPPPRLASIATAEARIARANLCELRRENPGTIGVFSTKINGLAMGIAGMGQRATDEAGIDYVVGQAESVDSIPAPCPGRNRCASS